MIKILLILIFMLSIGVAKAKEPTFNEWLKDFKKYALKNSISEKTFDESMSDVVFLPKVIEYDRFQPEHYEDTITYITKRTSTQKIKNGSKLFHKNKDFIISIEKKIFSRKRIIISINGNRN